MINTLCVFCGSSHGNSQSYTDAARRLGTLLAERKIRLVYGGGDIGLMGVVADTVMDAGGKVTGVIPQALADREVAHHGLTELRVVRSMHERKALMAELSDAFIALPGGFGTFEELCEIITWRQLGIHAKPCGLLNVDGYFDPLMAQIAAGVAQKFIQPEHHEIVISAKQPEELLDLVLASHPRAMEKLIDESQT